MLKEDRAKLKGAIGLLDQAIAPLKQAEDVVTGIAEKEAADVDGLEDADSDKNIERREKSEVLIEQSEHLQEMLDRLNSMKEFLEAF